MSWTTTFSTSQIVTATELNTLVPTMTQTLTAKGMNIIYQNTTDKIRIVSVTGTLSSTPGGASPDALYFYEASTSPPTGTQIGVFKTNLAIPAGQLIANTVTFPVKPTFYYTVSSEGNVAVFYWTEWDLF